MGTCRDSGDVVAVAPPVGVGTQDGGTAAGRAGIELRSVLWSRIYISCRGSADAEEELWGCRFSPTKFTGQVVGQVRMSEHFMFFRDIRTRMHKHC